MVDSAFSEWDKAAMVIRLNQHATGKAEAGFSVVSALTPVLLKANIALLLALLIIPALSGVA